MTQLETIIGKLKGAGLRRTVMRTAILKLLLASPSPLSVLEIHQGLADQGMHPNKTSVYREVEALLEHGAAEETAIRGARKIYLSSVGHHHHFVCTNCEGVYCVDDPELEESLLKAQEAISRVRGLTASSHDLTFYGRCASCA